MRNIRFIIYNIAIALLGLAIFASCSGNEQSEPSEGHTLIFYMMGDGTGLTSFMDKNIITLRSVAKDVPPENNHIVVYYDRGDIARLFEIKLEDGRSKEIDIKKYLNTTNSADPQFMSEVFMLIDETFNSDSYGVVFSSHGGGWVPSDIFDGYLLENMPSSVQNTPEAAPFYCGQDGLYYMEIPDMAKAINMAGLHFDYILFDACYMSSVEAMYDLRNCTDYIIASPCEVLADGFPYTSIIPMLFTKTHMLQSVCQAYVDHYQAKTDKADQSAAIALTDCSKLDALAEATRDIISNAGSNNVVASNIQGYDGFQPNLYYDFEQYAEQLCGGELTADFKAAMIAAFPFSAHTPQFFTVYDYEDGIVDLPRSCGVSCYVVDETSSKTCVRNTYQALLETNWAKAVGLK